MALRSLIDDQISFEKDFKSLKKIFHSIQIRNVHLSLEQVADIFPINRKAKNKSKNTSFTPKKSNWIDPLLTCVIILSKVVDL